MKTPAVSVLVPTYNVAPWLREALESLQAQSFRDFEVIIADDASSDDTREVAAAIAANDRRFRLVAYEKNVGMTANWNRALREARGRFLAKLDADDAFAPEALGRMMEEMTGGARPRVVFCRTLICDSALKPLESYRGDFALARAGIDPLRAHRLPGHTWFALCFDDIQLWHSNAQLHRSKDLIGAGGWDEDWGCASDTDLILRVLETGDTVSHLPYEGVRYRIRADSVSDEYRRRQWLAWESCLVHLDAIARYSAGGGRVTLPLRKAWYRQWRNWRELSGRGEVVLAGLDGERRERLVARSRRMPPPPWLVRLEGGCRRFAWNLLHRRSGGRSHRSHASRYGV